MGIRAGVSRSGEGRYLSLERLLDRLEPERNQGLNHR
jgi:hypothetical protein